MSRYNARTTEPKWQKAWDEAEAFLAKRDPNKPKYYVLEMFPYPSGRIHIGHVRFGMPAENAAMAIGGHPKEWTYGNIAAMKEQMKPLGLSIDWTREFATCDPEYYGQQQALFLDMLDADLVYRKNAIGRYDRAGQ